MKPQILLWKYNESHKKNIIIRGICFFSKMGALAAGYTEEEAEEISQYYHTAIYLPNIDRTYENVANVDISKFPKVRVKWAGAKVHDGKMKCDEIYEYKRDLTLDEYNKMLGYLSQSIIVRMGYHFIQFFSFIVTYPTRPVWSFLWNFMRIPPPFTRSKNRERCNSFVLIAFQKAGLLLMNVHPELAIVGEFILCKDLKRIQ